MFFSINNNNCTNIKKQMQFSMNVVATDFEGNLSRRYGIINIVTSHIAVSRKMGFPESLETVPSNHIFKCRI